MMPNTANDNPALAPVEFIDPAERHAKPEKGIALCLSGGGYRAMLFHVGSLWRLNETGLLPKIKRISSVSGGSITAALLGLRWNQLSFDANGVASKFVAEVVDRIRGFSEESIDVGAVVKGFFSSASKKVAEAYEEHLYGTATLQNLPDEPAPRFVINATNVQSAALWRFMKPYMRDYRVGEVKNPKVPLAVAVAASSAFPPFLSPCILELDENEYTPNSGRDLQRAPYTTNVELTDGGVYDNLGLETTWKRYDTILVSDAGQKIKEEPEPEHDWLEHTKRILDIVDNQVRSLRKRQLIDSFKRGERKGAYWGVRTNIADYQLPDPLPCPFEKTIQLAEVPTRLTSLEPEIQERLINWGYAVCDAALRKHFDTALKKPKDFPYPGVGVG